jgi:hypothetical protein
MDGCSSHLHAFVHGDYALLMLTHEAPCLSWLMQDPHAQRSKVTSGTSVSSGGGAAPPTPPGALVHASGRQQTLPPLRHTAGPAGLGLTHTSGLRASSPIPAQLGGTLPARPGSPAAVGNPLRATSPNLGPSQPQRETRQLGATSPVLRGAAIGRGAAGGGGGSGVGGSFFELEVADAILRYHFYVEHGIDACHVAPYRCVWHLACALHVLPAVHPWTWTAHARPGLAAAGSASRPTRVEAVGFVRALLARTSARLLGCVAFFCLLVPHTPTGRSGWATR